MAVNRLSHAAERRRLTLKSIILKARVDQANARERAKRAREELKSYQKRTGGGSDANLGALRSLASRRA